MAVGGGVVGEQWMASGWGPVSAAHLVLAQRMQPLLNYGPHVGLLALDRLERSEAFDERAAARLVHHVELGNLKRELEQRQVAHGTLLERLLLELGDPA